MVCLRLYVHPPAWQNGEVEEMTVRTKNKITVEYTILAMWILTEYDEENVAI